MSQDLNKRVELKTERLLLRPFEFKPAILILTIDATERPCYPIAMGTPTTSPTAPRTAAPKTPFQLRPNSPKRSRLVPQNRSKSDSIRPGPTYETEQNGTL